MNSEYTIKNFRVFDEEGVTIKIKPLTILTGCNSSGKSSIVKSLTLLDDFLKERKSGWLRGGKLDFSKRSNATLGGFSRVVNRDSSNKSIEFEHIVHSSTIGEDVKVKLVFEADKNDDLDNGYLKELTISNLKDEVIFCSNLDSISGDFNLLKNSFFRFVLGLYLIRFSIDYNDQLIYPKQSQDELESYFNKIQAFKESYIRKFGERSLIDVRKGFHYYYENFFPIKNKKNMDQSSESDLIFYFPIVDYLKDERKDGIINKVRQIPNVEDDWNFILFEIVMDDFLSSNCETFGDYYRLKEKEFLHFNIKQDKGPNEFEPRFWEISNRFIIYQDKRIEVSNEKGEIGPGYVNFEFIYFVMEWLDDCYSAESEKFHKKYEELFYHEGEGHPNFTYKHFIFEMFKEYIHWSISETILSDIPQKISHISSSIAEVKRNYTFEGNDSFSELLKNYFNSKRLFAHSKNENDKFVPGSFINKWIKKLNLGHSIDLEVSQDRLGVVIRLYHDDKDKKGNLLAEQGHGITQLLAILLRIEIAIMESETEIFPKDELFLGLACQLPIEDTFLARSPITLAFEEPEVHQHPKFQSMLAEIFVDAYIDYNVHFIIETHSEYLVRKMQLLVANNTIDNSKVTILYIYDKDNKPNYEPHVKQIGIKKDGMLDGSFGEGFFDEADMLTMFLLTAGKESDE